MGSQVPLMLEHPHPWLPTAAVLAPLPVPRKAPHSNSPIQPPPTAGPRLPLRLDLVQFRPSSSFLPPFPPQQAKVRRKKTTHLQNSRRPVWKKLTRQPAVQERLVAGACLGVSTERVTVGRKRSTGPPWGALATTVAMPLASPNMEAKSKYLSLEKLLKYGWLSLKLDITLLISITMLCGANKYSSHSY